MAYEQQGSEGIHTCGETIRRQNNWLIENPDLGLAFGWDFGLLDPNDHSDQQDQNFDVALHAFDSSGQFEAAIPSQYTVDSSTLWLLNQTAPSIDMGQTQLSEQQGYLPNDFVQARELFGPAEPSTLPFNPSNGFHDIQDYSLRVRTYYIRL
jgi:hypothetical protein